MSPRQAASIRGAGAAGVPVRVEEVGHVDLVVCGSVAVNRAGTRVGKGGGYSDLELALLAEIGAIDDRTLVATTVHPAQLLAGRLPETAHDFRVDLIVTPTEVIRTGSRKRTPGILWDHLDDEKIGSIPELRRRREASGLSGRIGTSRSSARTRPPEEPPAPRGR